MLIALLSIIVVNAFTIYAEKNPLLKYDAFRKDLAKELCKQIAKSPKQKRGRKSKKEIIDIPVKPMKKGRGRPKKNT
jgi:hypothetical protein